MIIKYSIEQFNQLYLKLPFLSKDQLAALYDLLPYILFDAPIQIVYNSFINEIVDFISTNLQENLSVDLLCTKFHVSRNYLYEVFRDNLGSTVNEYISSQRLKNAKVLLAEDSVLYIRLLNGSESITIPISADS